MKLEVKLMIFVHKRKGLAVFKTREAADPHRELSSDVGRIDCTKGWPILNECWTDNEIITSTCVQLSVG
jgi:hypothetical protein